MNRIFLLMVAIMICSSVTVMAEPIAVPEPKDRTGLELTIYADDLAHADDRRIVKFPDGQSVVRFSGLPRGLMPESVRFKADGVAVLEQDYAYDQLTPQRLLEMHVGREVRLVTRNPVSGAEDSVRALVMSVSPEGVVYKIGDEITFGHEGRLVFPSAPEGLTPNPSLGWLVQVAKGGAREARADYLFHGMGWRADYALTLDGAKAAVAEMQGWASVDNHSGAEYKDASVVLVAGNLNRVAEAAPHQDRMLMKAAEMSAPAISGGQFSEAGAFEYHSYALGRTVTLEDNHSKQIALVSARGIAVRRELVAKGPMYSPWGGGLDGSETDIPVGVYVEFKNDPKTGLGVALPGGTMRVFERDPSGSVRFVGEDRVEHMPVDGKVRLRVGSAFDIRAKRKQTAFERIGSSTQESGYEILLENHQDADVTVRVIETIAGDWKILSATHTYDKSSAHEVEFNVTVPKGGEVRIGYRVRVKS